MKTLNVDCRNSSDAIRVIKAYPIATSNWTILPPRSEYVNYSLFISFIHKLNNEKMLINVTLPLFKKAVQLLLQNSEAKSKLIKTALATKHNRLLKYIWYYTDEETKKSLMTKMLGAK